MKIHKVISIVIVVLFVLAPFLCDELLPKEPPQKAGKVPITVGTATPIPSTRIEPSEAGINSKTLRVDLKTSHQGKGTKMEFSIDGELNLIEGVEAIYSVKYKNEELNFPLTGSKEHLEGYTELPVVRITIIITGVNGYSKSIAVLENYFIGAYAGLFDMYLYPFLQGSKLL